jgi:hypothetical protein
MKDKQYNEVTHQLRRANFRKTHTVNWPVSIDVLLHYIAYLSCNGFSSSTVTTYISAISHFHKLNGFYDTRKKPENAKLKADADMLDSYDDLQT